MPAVLLLAASADPHGLPKYIKTKLIPSSMDTAPCAHLKRVALSQLLLFLSSSTLPSPPADPQPPSPLTLPQPPTVPAPFLCIPSFAPCASQSSSPHTQPLWPRLALLPPFPASSFSDALAALAFPNPAPAALPALALCALSHGSLSSLLTFSHSALPHALLTPEAIMQATAALCAASSCIAAHQAAEEALALANAALHDASSSFTAAVAGLGDDDTVWDDAAAEDVAGTAVGAMAGSAMAGSAVAAPGSAAGSTAAAAFGILPSSTSAGSTSPLAACSSLNPSGSIQNSGAASSSQSPTFLCSSPGAAASCCSPLPNPAPSLSPTPLAGVSPFASQGRARSSSAVSLKLPPRIHHPGLPFRPHLEGDGTLVDLASTEAAAASSPITFAEDSPTPLSGSPARSFIAMARARQQQQQQQQQSSPQQLQQPSPQRQAHFPSQKPIPASALDAALLNKRSSSRRIPFSLSTIQISFTTASEVSSAASAALLLARKQRVAALEEASRACTGLLGAPILTPSGLLALLSHLSPSSTTTAAGASSASQRHAPICYPELPALAALAPLLPPNCAAFAPLPPAAPLNQVWACGQNTHGELGCGGLAGSSATSASTAGPSSPPPLPP